MSEHTLDLDEVMDRMEPDPAPRQPATRRAAVWAGSVLLAGAIGGGALVAPPAVALAMSTQSAVDYWNALPTELPLDVALPQHTVLLDRNGAEFARFYSENRVDVGAGSISPLFTQALIATEDTRFYEHGGADFTGMGRALAANLTGASKQGASTITQQLVQNILINSARDTTEERVARGSSYVDKLREVKYAIALEDKLPKDEILTMYSNTVYFGNGAYGVEAASRIYFNTTASALDLPRAALIVGLVKGPSLYDPFKDPAAATNRRNTVLSRMASTGAITSAEAEAAAAAPLGLDRGSIPSGCASSTFPFYCALVREEILNDPAFGDTREAREDRLTRGGMTLTTALDPSAARIAGETVTSVLGNDNRGALGVALVVPGKGEITAIAQNRDWGSGPGQTEVVYATSPFQPGSAMKPITLATGLEQGIPASTKMLSNSPYVPETLDYPEGGFINYNNVSFGSIDARAAIKSSVNVYFIRLIQRTGVLQVADMAARLGISSFPRSGPLAIKGQEASLTLGAYEATPLEMASAYAVFAGNGVSCRAHAITAGIRSATGEPIQVPDPECHQAIAPAVANTVADALRQPFAPDGTLYQLKGGLTGRESGAKTGTTNDFAANWIVGITPQLSTAVWLGDPRGGSAHPLTSLQAFGRTYQNLTGSEVAAPVWKTIMDGALARTPAVPMPKADDNATATATGRSVPDVRGLSVNDALTLLIQNGITPVINARTAAPDGINPAGTTVAQIPSPGGSLGFKPEVEITLSAGSDTLIQNPARKEDK